MDKMKWGESLLQDHPTFYLVITTILIDRYIGAHSRYCLFKQIKNSFVNKLILVRIKFMYRIITLQLQQFRADLTVSDFDNVSVRSLAISACYLQVFPSVSYRSTFHLNGGDLCCRIQANHQGPLGVFRYLCRSSFGT